MTDTFTEWQVDLDFESEIEPAERAARVARAVQEIRQETEWLHSILDEPDHETGAPPI
jgi:hypothetical protein